MNNSKPSRAPAKGVVTLTQMLFAIQQGDYQQVRNLLARFNLEKFAPHRQDNHVWKFLNAAVTGRYPFIAKLLLIKFKKVNFPTSIGRPFIFTAIQQGDVEMIAVLAEFGADLNMRYNGTTPLFQASTSGLMSGVECLLQKGADPDSRGEYSQTALYVAAKQGNLKLLYVLLENGANMDTRDTFKQTPLHLAVKGGNFETVKFLVEKGADVNIQGKSDQTPLHLAAKRGNCEIGKFLVEKGADVNIQGKFKQTPLHSAVEGGNFEVVKFLVEKNGDVNLSDESGQTLLHLAAKYDNLEMIKFILEKYPHVNARDNSNHTPLHIAVHKGHLELVKLLLERGANLEAETNYGSRPLHLAAFSKHQEISNYLLEKGARVNVADQKQNTPLLAAIKPNNEGIVKLLISKGADIYVQTLSSGNILHYASYVDWKILKFLLQTDLDVNLNNDENRTPLFYAAKYNKLENVQILLKHGARLSTEDEKHKDLLELAYRSTPKILELILECHPNLYLRGADINCIDDKTCEEEHAEEWEEEKREIIDLENILLLVERGLDADMEITYRSVKATLLFHAMKKRCELVVRLLEAGANVGLASKYKRKYSEEDYYYKNKWNHWYSEYDDEDIEYEHSPLYAVILGEANHHSDSRLVTTLLQYGADVNNLSDDFDEKFSREHLSLNSDLREFIRHIAMMEDQDLEVDESILYRISEDFAEFYNECKEEIEKLKTEKFGESSSSFFELLTKNATQLAEFVRNKNVIDELQGVEYEERFPIYGSAITSQLEMGLRRRKLFDKAAQSCYTVFPCLPRSVSEEIFSYLESTDVRILILACQAARSRPWVPKQS